MKETLRRSEILRLQKDLERVRRTGQRIPGRVLYLRCAPSPTTESSRHSPPRRIAFLLGRGTGSAVVRNRLKRRLREIYRRHKDWFPEEHDYALHATPLAAGLDCHELEAHVEALTRRLRSDCTDN